LLVAESLYFSGAAQPYRINSLVFAWRSRRSDYLGSGNSVAQSLAASAKREEHVQSAKE